MDESASDLYHSTEQLTNYYDRRSTLTQEEYNDMLAKSNTLYLGNIPLETDDGKVYQIFSTFGPIK